MVIDKAWMDLWSNCSSCGLCKTAVKHVLFRGSLENNPVAFIGIGPGKSENVLGEPFVGPAGRILSRAEDDSGISNLPLIHFNLVACRPCDSRTGPNRDPTQFEIDACSSRVREIISSVKPRAFILLGKLVQLQIKKNLSLLSYAAVPTLLIHHPAYISRNGGIGSSVYQRYVESLRNFSRGIQ